jgi:hypothetical protein
MSLPPLQADIAPADPSTAAEQRLAALEAFARQNGFRG